MFFPLILFLAILLTRATTAAKEEKEGAFGLSPEEVKRRLEALNKKAKFDEVDINDLVKEEEELTKEHAKTKKKYGKSSREYVKSLHKLGRVIYQQEKFTEALEISKEIVKSHEVLDGIDAENTAHALNNVGAAANRVGDTVLCRIVLERALNILLKKHDDDQTNKEITMQRARMQTFMIPDARKTKGYAYNQYLREMQLYESGGVDGIIYDEDEDEEFEDAEL